MKLARRDAARYLASPDPARGALLLYGPDPNRIGIKRNEVVLARFAPHGSSVTRWYTGRIDDQDVVTGYIGDGGVEPCFAAPGGRPRLKGRAWHVLPASPSLHCTAPLLLPK